MWQVAATIAGTSRVNRIGQSTGRALNAPDSAWRDVCQEFPRIVPAQKSSAAIWSWVPRSDAVESAPAKSTASHDERPNHDRALVRNLASTERTRVSRPTNSRPVSVVRADADALLHSSHALGGSGVQDAGRISGDGPAKHFDGGAS